jgi:hypothetical protein
MPNLDWVKYRAACSAAQMFEKLKLEIESDVKTRNDLRPQGTFYGFSIVASGNGFAVILEALNTKKVVTFSLDKERISIQKEDESVLISTVTLNDEGHCLFKTGGLERESWQLRKMALESIFFEGF